MYVLPWEDVRFYDGKKKECVCSLSVGRLIYQKIVVGGAFADASC